MTLLEPTYRPTYRPTDRSTYRQTDRTDDYQSDYQTVKHTGTPADRQQWDGKMERLRDRARGMER